MELTKENVAARIEQLTREREQFVIEANKQIAALNGALQALQQLIDELPAPPQPETDKEKATQ